MDWMIGGIAHRTVDERLIPLSLDVGVDRASGSSIQELHTVTDAEHGFCRLLKEVEKHMVGFNAQRGRRLDVVGERPDQALRNRRASRDDQPVDEIDDAFDARFRRYHGNQHRDAAGLLDRLYIRVVYPLLAVLERGSNAYDDCHDEGYV